MNSNIKIVFVNTTHPGNIGAAARAMKTMGLNRLSLVNPHNFPCAESTSLASGADDILANADIHDHFLDAIAGSNLVIGTSARLRSIPMPQLSPRQAAIRAFQESASSEVAIVFGRERYGLTNEEINACHYLLNIPSSPDYSSLNIAAALQIVAYELRLQELENTPIPELPIEQAPVERVEGFFEHLKEVLTVIKYIDPDQSNSMMTRIRRLFLKARLDDNEINILRGILSAVQKTRR